MTDEEYKSSLKKYRKVSDRHVLVVETDMPYCKVLEIVTLSDKLRKEGNELVGFMKKKYDQLVRTKKYRNLLRLYGKTEDENKRKELAKQMNEMQASYNVTWDVCRKAMERINKKYNIKAVFSLTRAEDIWRGIEKCLYGNGKAIHFLKHGDLPCVRAKQIDRAILIKEKDKGLSFTLDNISFGIKIKDGFQQDEIDAVLFYLSMPDLVDEYAVTTLLETSECVSTYRPCYASLVPKLIRGKYRVFLHLTIEGKAVTKYNKNGEKRYKYGKGVVGADIGTQTVAYTSAQEVGLKNLSERGSSISTNERRERLLYRAMDRSRRATNPQYYNEDGTIKKGKKNWKYSNHYKKLRARHKELCRINTVNRQLAINEDVNHLRSLGDVFITEPKNASKLMKRAKKTTKNEKGKFNRKKRFGRSIKNRCPGGFQSTVEKKFVSSGGTYIEVSNNYRASQYDHTADDYIKKKLSDRLYKLKNGTEVQRDWYSSFLLYCYDSEKEVINKDKCLKEFKPLYEKELSLIEYIKRNRLKILNSGIKVV